MAILDPVLSETLRALCAWLIRDALEVAVEMGVPEPMIERVRYASCTLSKLERQQIP
jgi:hypothetical protein